MREIHLCEPWGVGCELCFRGRFAQSVVQSGRRKLKPSGSREFSAEEHDRMSDSTAAGRKDTAGSPAVDSPINR